MNCPKCDTPMVLKLALTGGCRGHSGEAYCYCDSADVHAEWACHYQGPRGRYCLQKALPISELSDKYSIARWLAAHYVQPQPSGKARH